jgi:hypothetical protein
MRQFTVCAIAYDQFGYSLRPKSLDQKIYRVDFLTKAEFLSSGLQYDGLIFPSGVFERHRIQPDRDIERIIVESETENIFHVESRINQILERGGWVCCTVDSIVDRVNESSRATIVNDTDLAKRLLNGLNVQRSLVNARPLLTNQSTHFEDFFKRYASPQTQFVLPADPGIEEIAGFWNGSFAFSFEKKIYFLPHFKTVPKTQPISDVIQCLADSILADRAQRSSSGQSSELPSWLSHFEFESEKQLRLMKEEQLKKITELEGEIKRLESWKKLLISQDNELENLLQQIFNRHYGLNIQKCSVPEGFSAWNIQGPQGCPFALLLSCSSSEEIRRQHLNTADSLRETLGLSAETPILLIANDFLSLNHWDHRALQSPSSDKMAHARNLRISLLRAIDLLKHMRECEPWPLERRREDILNRLLEGGNRASSPSIRKS